MKDQQEYTRDIAEIRSMMERSSKFLSLSGWAGIMAGLYALAGAYIAYAYLNFKPDGIQYMGINSGSGAASILNVSALAVLVLVLAVGTAAVLSYQKAGNRGEKIWNAASRQLLVNFAVPLGTGGIVLMILISNGLAGLLAPFTLLFYGLALFSAGKFTYDELKYLGAIQIALGLLALCFIEYSILLWGIGFGALHIAYGIYLYFKYER